MAEDTRGDGVIDPALDAYDIEMRRRGLAASTRADHRRLIRSFVAWAEPRDVLDLDRFAIEDFLEESDISTGTRNAYTSQLNRFYGCAVGVGLIGSNPAAAIEMLAVAAPVRRATPPGDGRKLRRSQRVRPGPVADGTDELIARFDLAQARRALSDGTRQHRRVRLTALARWAHPAGLLQVDREQVEQFLDTRALGPSSRYHYISDLHEFYAWAIDEEIADLDPTAKIARPRMPRRIPRPVTDDVLEAALGGADVEMQAMIALAGYAGLRCKEIAGLDRRDVLDRNNKPPLIVVTDGKGGHQRVLPLHERARAALNRVGTAKGGPVFRRPDGQGYTPGEVSKKINRYLESLGLEATAHQFRHWFGTRSHAKGKDLRLVQQLMGHASITTTAGYVGWSNQEASNVIDQM